MLSAVTNENRSGSGNLQPAPGWASVTNYKKRSQQDLETTATKEDKYAQLRSASESLLQTSGSRDGFSGGGLTESIDLWQLLQQSSRVQQTGGAQQNYFLRSYNKKRLKQTQNQWQPHLQSVDCRSIPRAIRNLYSHVECEMFMGLFPEIARAWITIDNRLFLWNYYKGEDFYMYDGLDQLIVSVGLVRPKPGVFGKDTPFVLVISTPVEIVLLELKILGDWITGDIELYPTMYNLPSDNVPMRSIVGTPQGNIFLGGHDGALYEFIYEKPGLAHTLGIKRQCRKVEHSGVGPVKWLVPSFIRGLAGKSDPLIKLAFDDERSFLYTLTDRSVLTLYTVSAEGPRMIKTIEDLSKVARKYVQNPAHRTSISGLLPQHLNGRLRLVNLSVVNSRESHVIHLVAISSSGVRFYMSTTKGGKPGKALEIKHIRGPPNHELAAASHNAESDIGVAPGPTMKNVVSSGYYNGGITMVATTNSENGNLTSLTGFSIDLSMRENKDGVELKWQWQNYHEMAEDDILNQGPLLRDTSGIVSQGRVWDIAEEILYPGIDQDREMINVHIVQDPFEIPAAPPSTAVNNNGKRPITSTSSSSAAQDKPAPIGPTELASQHLILRRTFLVLSSTGLWSITKNRPVNQLNQLLSGPEPGSSADVEEFFKLYGLNETCSMLLAIASCSTQQDVAQKALYWFQRMGYSFSGDQRLPRFDQVLTDRVNAVAVMVQQSQIVHSGCFTGLQLYLSRLLRPFWDWTVVTSKGGCRWTPNQVSMLIDPLERLHQYLKTLDFLQIDGKNYQPSKRLGLPKPNALAVENATISSMHKLIVRTVEGLQVFGVIQEFGPIHKFVSTENRAKLLKMTWRDLVCSLDGNVIVSSIIKAVVEWDSSLAKTIIDRLGEAAPSFFSEGDVLHVRALEELGKAVHTQGAARESLIKSALENLKKGLTAASQAKFPLAIRELKTVCQNFEKLGCKRYSADLALHCAATYSTEYREGCYEIILNILGDEQSRKEVWDVVVASSLKDWHYHLYKWCLKNGLRRELLETNSTFIVPFLSDPKACPPELAAPNVSHADAHLLVLCDWLAFNKRNAEAAVVLRRLATLHVPADPTSVEDQASNPNPNLAERLGYFTRGWIQAKAAEATNSLHEFGLDIRQLKDEFDICKLQMEVHRALVDRDESKQQQTSLWWNLVTVTDLYNLYAYPNKLWEQCIAIIVSCNYNDASEIQMLYRQIVTQIMQKFGDEDFEDSSRWTTVLEERILVLGKRFFVEGSKSDAFPVQFLIQELEDVQGIVCSQQRTTKWNPWIVNVMIKIGVPYQDIFDAYCYYDGHVTSDRAKIFVVSALIYTVQKALKKGEGGQLELVRTRDHLERLSVIVGGLHGDDVTQQERNQVIQEISDVLATL